MWLPIVVLHVLSCYQRVPQLSLELCWCSGRGLCCECVREKSRQAGMFKDYSPCPWMALGEELCLFQGAFPGDQLCLEQSMMLQEKRFSCVVKLAGHLCLGFCSLVASRPIGTGAQRGWGSLRSLRGWLCWDVLTHIIMWRIRGRNHYASLIFKKVKIKA